ncbi:MAG: T9SS type A sorting domain-containing protein [Saprospiraceae bacterium]
MNTILPQKETHLKTDQVRKASRLQSIALIAGIVTLSFGLQSWTPPSVALVPVGAWNKLTPAQRQALQGGGTVANFNLGICNGTTPITATINANPASNAPTPNTINTRLPRRWGNNSFYLARQNPSTSGVEYCFDFSEPVPFSMDTRSHAYFANNENITVSASNAGTPVNLTGAYHPASSGLALLMGNGTPTVHFDANGYPVGGLWWEVNSAMAPVTQVCIQYYSTVPFAEPTAEPFALYIDGVKCVADDLVTCNGASPVSRWNKLTTSQRMDLDNGTPVHQFNSGFCNESGEPIHFVEISSALSAASGSPYLNNKEPRPYGRYSFDNGRDYVGPGGSTYCFTLDEAVPVRLNSLEESFFAYNERVIVSAYLGVDPVILTGFPSSQGGGPATGNASGVSLGSNAQGPGAWWEATSGNQPVSQVCVEYYKIGGGALSREPFALELCANRCLYDDLFACSVAPTGVPTACASLPLIDIQKSATVVNNYGLTACGSGTISNTVVQFSITVNNYGGAEKQLFLEDDLQTYLGSAFVNVVEPPVVTASSAADNPMINPLFDGRTSIDIIIPGSGYLQKNQFYTITFSVELLPTANPLTNVVFGGGVANGGVSGTDVSGNLGGGYVWPTQVPHLPPGVVAVPAHDVTLEATLMNWMNGIPNFLANHGGASFSVPGCNPVVWTNDYDPANFEVGCGYITGTVDVTFFATDACGHVFTTCATFTLEDTQPPSCVKPTNLTLDCSDPNAAAILDDWLNYDGHWSDLSQPVVFTYDFPGLMGNECNGDPITVTWTGTDNCGNSTVFVGTLTVVDNAPPVLSGVPADVTLDMCTMLPDPAGVTATDACDTSVVIVFEETTAGDSCDFTITRTWTATDDCGNSVSDSQFITVQDNEAPVLSNVPADVTVDCPDIPAVVDPTVSDCSAVTLVFQEEQIGGPCPAPSQIIRTWTATDACGHVTVVQQVITVNSSSSITFTFIPPDVTATCDQNPMFGDPIAETTCPTGGLSISFEDEVMNNGDCSQPFTITRTWTAHDDCGNLEQATQTLTIGPDVEAPIFDAGNPASIMVDCGDAPVLPVAFDNCGPTSLSYVDSNVVGDCATGFTFTRHWTATDLCGNTSSFSQDVTTTPDTTPPVFTFVPYDQFFDCDEPIVFPDPVAVDNCGGVTITFQDSIIGTGDCHEVNGILYGYDIVRTWTATDDCGNMATATTSAWVLPGFNNGNLIAFAYVPENQTVTCGGNIAFGIPICHSACGALTITHEDVVDENCLNGSVFTRTWTATDVCGNATSCSQTIVKQADAQPPAFSNIPQPIAISCGTAPVFGDPVVTDNCAYGTSITVTFNDMVVNNGPCNGQTIMRTWTATDPCGNTSSVSSSIVIVDDVAPAFSFVPQSKTIGCGEPVEFGNPQAADACSSINMTHTDQTTQAGCDGSFYYVRIWTVTDACGNSAQASQTITVVDTDPPVFSFVPADKTITCGEAMVFGTPQVTDACSQMSISYSDFTENGSCAGSKQTTRTWTATDACGNTAQATQTISRMDTEPPFFYSNITDKTAQCGVPIVFDNVEAVDACSNVVLTYVDNFEPGNCGGMHTRLWTATDACGNSAILSQSIQVVDTEAPVFGTMPSYLTMPQSVFDAWQVPVANVVDCGEVSVETVHTVNATCETVSHNFTYTATDECGNSSSHVLTVEILDGSFNADFIAPVIMDCGQEFDLTVLVSNGTAPYNYSWGLVSGNGWDIPNDVDASTVTILAGEGAAQVVVYVSDANGCTVSRVMTVECEGTASAVKDDELTGLEIFPNPAYESLTVRYGATLNGETELQVLNTLGELVETRRTTSVPGKNEQHFDVSAWVPGTYFLTLSMGDSFVVRRFVKAR